MRTDPRSISVAMAAYNGASFIEEQLRSIWQQTFLPSEIVVVDDASQDATFDLLTTLARQSPVPMRVLGSERNQGSTRAFARAVAASSGSWIALADQDDVWLPHKLATLLEAAERQQWNAVFSNAQLVDEKLQPKANTLLDNTRVPRKARRQLGAGRALPTLLRYNVVTGATLMLHADWKQHILPIDDAWIHDYWIALIVASTGRIGLVDEPLLLYRQHDRNQIGEKKNLKQELAAARAKAKQEYLQEEERFASLERRLAGVETCVPGVLRFLREKQSFLRHRYLMRKKAPLRLPLILVDLLRLSYFRYGQGLRPLLKDLLIP